MYVLRTTLCTKCLAKAPIGSLMFVEITNMEFVREASNDRAKAIAVDSDETLNIALGTDTEGANASPVDWAITSIPV